jgi:hypothetical protein
MFYIEKGNWYIDQYMWAEYGLFREGDVAPFVVTQSEEVANFVTKKLNEDEDVD